MKKILHRTRLFLPAVLWAIVIFTFSSYPTGSVSSFYWQDFIIKKLAHVFEYGLLTIFVYRGLWNSGIGRRKAIGYAALIAIFYGITDEVHQSFTPGREPRVRDIVFDTIGALSAVYIIWKLLPVAPPRLRKLAKSFQLV